MSKYLHSPLKTKKLPKGIPYIISNEAADLIYHLQVALANHGVDWRAVLEVLIRRRGAPRRK